MNENPLLSLLKVFVRLFMILVLAVPVWSGCKEPSGNGHPSEGFVDVTVSPGGGTYDLSNGFTVIVPAGAVAVDTTLGIRRLTVEELTPIFDIRGVPTDRILGGFEGRPDGLTFSQPINIIMPADIEPGEVPLAHGVNLADVTYSPIETALTGDPDAGTVEVTVSHFSQLSVEQIEELKRGSEGCTASPCRCGRIEVRQSEIDLYCQSGDCVKNESKLSMRFLDCDGQPVEESYLREMSAGCVPDMTLTAGSSTLSTGGSTGVTAYVTVACGTGEEDQRVDFTVSGPATVSPAFATTDAEGNAGTTLTAGEEEGTATVTADATISWSTYSLYASAGGEEETANGPLVTKSVSKSVNVEITDVKEYHITVDAVFPPSSGGTDDGFWVTSIGNYSVHLEFDFTLNEEYRSQGYYSYCNDPEQNCEEPGIAAAGTQVLESITIEPGTSLVCSLTVENAYAPPSFTYPVGGMVFFSDTDTTIYIGEDGSSDFNLLTYDLLLTPYVAGESYCNPDATWNDSETLGGIVFSDNALPLNGVTTHTAQYLTRGTGWVDGTTTVTVEEK